MKKRLYEFKEMKEARKEFQMIKEKWQSQIKKHEETTKEMQGLIRKILNKRNVVSKLDKEYKMTLYDIQENEKKLQKLQLKINNENELISNLSALLQEKYKILKGASMESNIESSIDLKEFKKDLE